MADADILPYDYVTYGRQITAYLYAAQTRAREAGLANIDFNEALGAATRFTAAATIAYSKEINATGDPTFLNHSLRAVETDLLNPDGLPGRPWFKHVIFAPGEYTGYAAVVIPGVNEAIDKHDASRAQEQMADVTAALVRAAASLEDGM